MCVSVWVWFFCNLLRHHPTFWVSPYDLHSVVFAEWAAASMVADPTCHWRLLKRGWTACLTSFANTLSRGKKQSWKRWNWKTEKNILESIRLFASGSWRIQFAKAKRERGKARERRRSFFSWESQQWRHERYCIPRYDCFGCCNYIACFCPSFRIQNRRFQIFKRMDSRCFRSW